ncbi:MAG TPA: protein kinase, partial [Vicinamibacterales bacterium]|nr:protein kinase [Vicinamibacterales bacterium]
MTCSSCRVPIPDGSRFCPSCGAAVDPSNAPTQLGTGETRLAGPASPPTSGGRTSGWLSSSGSIDHGRFAPGSVFDGRYRIIGLLGRGGMGEVYRADDLRLGQPVALKLLPKALGQDARRLAQFHNEVRTARQVSHPNVCRVYDIGDVDGDLYLSMEYVDGEDLAASLKRIGRFPEDKALEVARQIAAGLGAAHDRSVIHRDLKPANIMLDAAGKARIMDFGLAAIGDVGDVRVGTPAYMAPEQLEGREVTARSDIYALGLVLYELFTGRRALTGATVAELVQQQQSGTITAPTAVVKDLDPTIERAILRCLDRDPARRPASALAVSASLPGGDPLAAALAAGETPSPEMVAAAGGNEALLSRGGRLAWVAATAALLISGAAISSRVSILAATPVEKPAEVLADRAEQIRQAFGYREPAADIAAAFVYDQPYLAWAAKQGAGKTNWSVLASGRPAPIRFWRRTSPRALVPLSVLGDVTREDPPIAIATMTLVELDTSGRLIRFVAAPPEVEKAPTDAAALDWTAMFAAAGLDQQKFSSTPPERTPPTFADDRRAWEGPLPDSDVTVRVEGASYRGRPVLFAIVGAWTPASRDADYTPASDSGPLQTVVVLLLLLGAAWLARLNLRSGRADRRGAFRLAAFTFLMMTAIWLVSPHVPSITDERTR